MPLAILCLGGCASHNPETVAPAQEPPAQWVAGTSIPGVVPDRWWEQFGSTELNAAVDEALTRNWDLQVAVARIDAAAAQARIAGADLSPQISAGFDGRRAKQNFIGLPIPGAGGGVLSTHSTTYGLNLNLVWEIDLWGRVRSGKRAALRELAASGADLAGARHSVAGQTVKAWLAMAAARQQLDLARATVASYRSTVAQVRDRYQSGLRSPLDLELSQSSLSATEAVVEQRQAQLAQAVRQFETLLGRYPSGEAQAEVALPSVPPPVPAGMPSEILSRRPDLAAAEQRVRAALARHDEAQAARLPRLSLTTQGGTSSDQLRDLVSSDFTVWSLAANAAQPLLDGGRLKANAEAADARSREAMAGYNRAAQQAFREVESALAVEAILARQEDRFEQAGRQAESARHLAEERYLAGLENFATVLEAQRRALDADSQRVETRRQRLDNRVDLQLALGGGFATAPEATDTAANVPSQP